MELENCQRKFTKSIRGLDDLSYRDRLIKLGLTTLLERRARGDLIEIFKIESGFVAYGQHMFRKGSTGRRLHLVVSLIRTNLSAGQLCTGIGYLWQLEPHHHLQTLRQC